MSNSVDELSSGMDTTRLGESKADRQFRAERERDVVVILGSRGLWDVIRILGLTDAAIDEVVARGHAAKLVTLGLVDPEPEPEPPPEPEPRQTTATYMRCEVCEAFYRRINNNQRFCTPRCQRKARRERARQAGRIT